MRKRIPIAFLKEDSPMVVAAVTRPGLTSSEPIRFLVDTEAFHTAISQDDARRIGIDLDEHSPAPFSMKGIGGSVRAFDIGPTVLAFACEDGGACEVWQDTTYAMENPRSKRARGLKIALPSLLGRAFMKEHGIRIAMDFRHNHGHLETDQ